VLGVPAKTRKVAGRSESDPQQDAVYRWEGSWKAWNRAELTLTECRSAISWACDQFGIAAPRVGQHAGKSYPWCDVEKRVVSFSLKGKNVATALHEAAHLIVNDVFGARVQDHGPTFLGAYMWLLETAGVAPRIALHATARSHGLKWRHLSPEQCSAS
jgi:hypothetical protein